MESKKKIKLATVFSGIGAIEQAFKRLNIDYSVVFACDNGERIVDYDYDEEREKIESLTSIEEKRLYVENLYSKKTKRTNFVQKSYIANYANLLENNNFFQDIRLLDGRDFTNKVDILVGGSPCQSFSSVGLKGGLNDTRGTLFYDYAKLIKDVNPKVFVYENVRGLTTHDNGRTWSIMKNVFDELGYTVHENILNAADYGIPQRRRRIFVVGFRKDINLFNNFEFPFPIDLKYSMSDFLLTNCSFGSFSYKDNGELILGKEKGKVKTMNVLTPKLYDYVMKDGTKSFKQKAEIDQAIARTLLSTMGNRHRAGIDNYVSDLKDKKPIYNENPNNIRMLDEREAHRLMGFTDDYHIVVSRAQAYKQAGNSIVVDVLMEILKNIISTGVFYD